MEKFKYEKYNYSKIGIKPKIHFQQIIDNSQYNALGYIFSSNGRDLVNLLTEELKKAYANKMSYDKGINYSVSDIDFEWTVITPDGTYKSNEASS